MVDAFKTLINSILDLIKGYGVEGGILEIIRDFFDNLFGSKAE